MNQYPILTILTFIPLAGGLALLGIRADRPRLARGIGMAVGLATLALALMIWVAYDRSNGGMQFVERAAWIPSLAVEYHLGIDGLGMLMVLLSALLIPFAMRASWNVEHDARLYFALMLFLESGLFGTFTALNFVHWFLFWELSLLPAFFLIKIWGGPRRTAAAYQFFVYTLAGSVTLLLAFLALYAATGLFDFGQLAAAARDGSLNSALFAKLGGHLFSSKEALAGTIFLGAFLGFAVKVPLMPFHTWLPDAYAEAPTGTSMVLTGVMSKMGVYGFLRILLPIFPEPLRAMQTPLLWLAVATIVFSAAAAFAQTDLKRIIAYSSINHLGYCLMGVFTAAQLAEPSARWADERAAILNGVMLQMFNHGITAACLFFFVGLIEQRAGGSRGLNDFGGLGKTAPVFYGLMGIALFASLGLPGLNGFVGEILIFKGGLPLAPWATPVSTLGLLITAVFVLTVLQRVFTGPLATRWTGWTDLTVTERLIVAPAIALIFILGIYPRILVDVANPTVLKMVGNF